MRKIVRTNVSLGALVAFTVGAQAQEPDWPNLLYTPHAVFQAVDSDGNGTFPLNAPVKMRGIWLNRSSDMLNGTPDLPSFFGGQWQVFVQSQADADFGGTALFMGQRYSDLPFLPPDWHYSPAEWLAEVNRIEHDPTTGHAFVPGDLVEIRARAPGLFFGGKTNINEQHNIDPAVNFDVVLLQAGVGLPEPTVFALWQVKDATNAFLFDSSRLTGAEHFQGVLARLNGVTFVDTTNWGPDALLTVQDPTGRTFTVHLGRGPGFSSNPAPTGPVDLIGIYNQESGGPPFDNGYELWIMDDVGGVTPSCTGDVDGDRDVDLSDLASLLSHFGTGNGAFLTDGDMDADGDVDLSDLALLLAYFGTSCP